MFPAQSLEDTFDCPIRRTEAAAELRLEWDNRRVQKDGCLYCVLLLFEVVWLPATVYVTSMIFHPLGPADFFVDRAAFFAFSVIGWLGAILVPCRLFQGLWRVDRRFKREARLGGRGLAGTEAEGRSVGRHCRNQDRLALCSKRSGIASNPHETAGIRAFSGAVLPELLP